MATNAEGLQVDKLTTAREEYLGVQFLQEAVTSSLQLYSYKGKEREKAMRLDKNTTQTLWQIMMTQLRRWDKGEAEEKRKMRTRKRKTGTQTEKGGTQRRAEEAGETRRRNRTQSILMR